MSKLKSADIKLFITAHVIAHSDELSNEFVPPEDMGPAMLAKNWKRFEKCRGGWSGNGREWQRGFDCTPYDDQLRAYVTTNEMDTEVISIEVLGE